jgi:hypothetical protein
MFLSYSLRFYFPFSTLVIAVFISYSALLQVYFSTPIAYGSVWNKAIAHNQQTTPFLGQSVQIGLAVYWNARTHKTVLPAS